jgi:hypothetical protein
LAVREFEGPLNQMTIFTFAELWFIGNILIYAIMRATYKSRKCSLTKLANNK